MAEDEPPLPRWAAELPVICTGRGRHPRWVFAAVDANGGIARIERLPRSDDRQRTWEPAEYLRVQRFRCPRCHQDRNIRSRRLIAAVDAAVDAGIWVVDLSYDQY